MCASQFCSCQPCLRKISNGKAQWPDGSDEDRREATGSYVVCPCSGCIKDTLHEYEQYRPKLASMIDDVYRNSPEAQQIDRHIHERLHILWIGFFTELFQNFYRLRGEKWMLKPYEESHNDAVVTNDQPLWQTTVKARVRFDCECGHVWTSQMGRAKFWVKETNFPVPGTKQLIFRLLTQNCSHCPFGRETPAAWYPYEVVRVLLYVYKKISDEFGHKTSPAAHFAPNSAPKSIQHPSSGQPSTPTSSFQHRTPRLSLHSPPKAPETDGDARQTRPMSNYSAVGVQLDGKALLKFVANRPLRKNGFVGDQPISDIKRHFDCDGSSNRSNGYLQKPIPPG